MVDRKISQFEVMSAAQADGDDTLPIVDASAGSTAAGNKRIALSALQTVLTGSLQSALETETSRRVAGDAALQVQINGLSAASVQGLSGPFASVEAGEAATGPGDQFIVADPATGRVDLYENVAGAGTYRMEWSQVRVLPTRQSLVDAVAAGLTHVNGTTMVAGGLSYIAEAGATAIPDMPGWVPDGNIYPEHMADNTVPGVTDMSAAIQLAVDFAIARSQFFDTGIDKTPACRVDFRPRSYYMSTGVKWPSSAHRVELHGNGALVQSDANSYMFRGGDDVIFDSADAAGSTSAYSWVVKGFVFRNTNTTASASVCLQFGRAWNFHVSENKFWDFNIACDLYSVGHSFIENNFFFIRGRGSVDSTAFIRHQGVFDSTSARSSGAGLSCHNNDFSGHPTQRDRLQSSIEIKAIDAFYFGANHFSFARTHLRLAPTGSDDNYKNNFIIDILSAGANYFDDSGTGAQVSIDGRIAYDPDVEGVGTRARGHLSNVVFLGSDKFRGDGRAINGFAMSLQDTSLVGGSYLTNRGLPRINLAGLFAGHVGTHIVISGIPSSRVPAHLTVDNVTSKDWVRASPGSQSLVYQEGGILRVGKNVIVEPEVTAPARLISYNGQGGGNLGWACIVDDFDALRSTYTESNPVVLANTSDILVDIAAIKRPGLIGRHQVRPFSVTFSGVGPVVALTHDMPSAMSMYAVRFVAVGDSTNAGEGDRFAHIEESAVVRRDGAESAVMRRTGVHNDRSVGWTSNGYPASLVLLTGTAWGATTAYTAGDVRTNDGNVYLCVVAGTSAGSGGPSGTAGLITDGTVTWVYCGAISANRLAVVLSGVSGFNMRWAGRVEVTGV